MARIMDLKLLDPVIILLTWIGHAIRLCRRWYLSARRRVVLRHGGRGGPRRRPKGRTRVRPEANGTCP